MIAFNTVVQHSLICVFVIIIIIIIIIIAQNKRLLL